VDKNIIDQLARKLSEAVPGDLHTLRADLENNFRSLLQTTLGKLDLVTREEFDVQRKVLERTREKLEAIERTLAEMQHDAGGHADNKNPQGR
jgi:BMFP domain-containing protein YqiC